MSEAVPTQTKGMSLKSYASGVFKESSIGAVSSFASTTSTKRRVFKGLIFTLCLIGFLYQFSKLLSIVLKNSTVIDISVQRPDTFEVPAFSFCNNNGINRRLFCKKYPRYCEEPSAEFCNMFPGYCGENKTLIPKKEYYHMHNGMSNEEIISLNTPKEDFVDELMSEGNITGPYFRTLRYTEAFICYSLNERVNDALYPRNFTKNSIIAVPVNKLRFKINHDEMFFPGNEIGVIFAIHSPFEAIDPTLKGLFMIPGRFYIIFISMEEQISEGPSADCMDYIKIWEKNGRAGPRTQIMCLHNCYSDISILCENCVDEFLLYPRPERVCENETLARRPDNTCFANVKPLIENCKLKCKEDCRHLRYHYTVQERTKSHFDMDGDRQEDVDNTIDVDIYLLEDEITVYKHSPKYTIVEVFSAIGGLIGIWLGMSLLHISDLFDGFVRIFWYSVKKR